MDRIEVNVITGEQQIIPLTPEEIAEIQSRPQPEPPSPLALAEVHVSSHFSTPRLLQMKVWWDQFPHEDTPKLAAVFNWTTAVTVAASQGQTTFPEPPHAFEELLAEAVPLLNVSPAPVTEPVAPVEPEPIAPAEPEPDPAEEP